MILIPNWVKRLRKKACYEIPSATERSDYKPTPKQEVVKIEVIPNEQSPVIIPAESATLSMETVSPVFNIMIGNVSINISNNVDPKLLSQVIKTVTGKC